MIDPVLDQPLIRQLHQLASDVGFKVERSDDGPPLLGGGVCIYSDRVIRISTRFADLDALPVLIHEVAHALLHSATPYYEEAERGRHEEEASWVEHAVMAELDLEDLMLSDEQHPPGEPPSEAAQSAARRIVDSFPVRVVHYLAPARRSGTLDDSRSLHDRLFESCLVLGLSFVRVQGWSGVQGQHIAGSTVVALADGLPDDEDACVLAHEIAHALQHSPGQSYSPPTDAERALAERVAHGAARILLLQLGGPDYESVARRRGYPDFVPLSDLDPVERDEARQIAMIIARAASLYRVEGASDQRQAPSSGS